jgi:acyl-CoA synthetase (AMP-forming)/AMP-acid ligase II
MKARLQGPPLQPSPFRTFPEALAAAAASAGRVVLVSAGEEELALTWAEVRSRARRMAAALMARGVAPGDRVAMVLPTGRDFLDAFFGAWLAGAVPVPLYPPVRLGRMDEYARATARMLTCAGARVVLSDRRIRLLLGRALETVALPLGAPTVAELMEETAEAERPSNPEDLGLIQFSSGSTVDPRPVALTHANLLAQCAALKQLLPMPEGGSNTGVSWLPLYHDMGLIGCLLAAAAWPGGSLALLPPEAFLARPAIWLRTLSRHRGIISPAPNFAYGLCLKRVRDEELEGVDLSAWRYALDGAEPVSAELLERFADRFARFGFRREALMPVYGLSEASLAVTFTAPEGTKRVLRLDGQRLAVDGRLAPGNRALVSVGTAVPGVELEVRGEAVLDEGQVGRVFVRGASVMRGYAGQPEATARALSADRWLDTGDLGFVDQGELFLCGRAKDLVIIRGANHAPQEFEECLDGLPGLRAGCAVALGALLDGGTEESLLVLAEVTEGGLPGLATAVSGAVVERTGVRPGQVVLLAPGTLPRTSSGKLRRAEALRRYLAGELAAPRPATLITVGGELARSAAAHARRVLKGAGA